MKWILSIMGITCIAKHDASAVLLKVGFDKITRISRVIFSLLPSCLIAVGIILRLRQYLFNRSLWIDEASLAVTILDRSYTELFKPLGETQHAPIGFLLLEKLIVSLFGNSEYSLRLIPLLAGCASLILIYRLTRSLIGEKAAIISLTIFAFANPLIYYASEMKQYASDVFVMLVGYILFIVSKPKHWIITGLIGALIVWFSHPIVLVLIAILLSTWPRYVKPSIVWLASVVVNFVVITHTYFFDTDYTDWTESFLPVPKNISDVSVLIDRLKTLPNVAGTPLAATIILVTLGLVVLWKKKKHSIVLLFLIPPFLTIVASFLKLYPFMLRLLIFIAPSIIIIVATTITEILNYTYRRGGIVGLSMAAIALYAGFFQFPFSQALYHINHPYQVEEIKPVLEYIEERRMPGDTVYVYGGFNAYRYYTPRFHLTTIPTMMRKAPRFNHLSLVTELEPIRGQSRIWFVFSHVLQDPTVNDMNDNKFLLSYLERIGQRIDQIQVVGSSAYLYDLSTNRQHK